MSILGILGIIYAAGCVITFFGVLEWAAHLEDMVANEVWDDFRYGTKWRSEQESVIRFSRQLSLQDRAEKLRKSSFFTAILWPFVLAALAYLGWAVISKKHV